MLINVKAINDRLLGFIGNMVSTTLTNKNLFSFFIMLLNLPKIHGYKFIVKKLIFSGKCPTTNVNSLK